MEEVIEPVSKELIIAELTEDKRLRMTNKSNNQIYIITCLLYTSDAADEL